MYSGLSETSKIECFNVTSVYNVMNVTPVCKKTGNKKLITALNPFVEPFEGVRKIFHQNTNTIFEKALE